MATAGPGLADLATALQQAHDAADRLYLDIDDETGTDQDDRPAHRTAASCPPTAAAVSWSPSPSSLPRRETDEALVRLQGPHLPIDEYAGMKTFEVPASIMEQLLLGVLSHEVPLTLKHTKPGELAIVSDQLGDVLTWLWQADADWAVTFVADYLAQSRYWDANASRSITLDQLVDGLASVVSLPNEQRDAMTERLRREVPRRFDDDVTQSR
ncbi:hypothetical protein EV385_6596 [Krasilnikovia cinnamomea]|uniref:Uncharacterized protein n=1 Tax=Krasilnikovia cinnamomea TaxID=349313 RepID=A0A4Q7Z7N2_9ACTN|nr:hypothetical protein [Krasilnikovia cinnamomea]RZU46522.1 hypothetical protein EV385_6596 [Krasilnikovia cinnamomea]